MNYSELFIYFFCYSFLGWLYESTLCSLIGQRRFINRGFLLGPYCPIYGTGAVLCWMISKNSVNVFQLHGRICLYGGIIFGVANVVIRFIIQPVLMEWTVNMGHELILKLSLLLLVMMTLDTALTLITWKGLNHHLGLIHDAIYDKTDGTFSRLTDRFWEMRISFIIEKGYVLVVHIQNLNVKLARNELRFFQAFPDIRILLLMTAIKTF